MKFVLNILFALLCCSSLAQDLQILVVDKASNPIPGASIFVNNTQVAVSNVNGIAIIKSTTATVTLKVKFLGFVDFEQTLTAEDFKSKSPYRIKLVTDNKSLKQVEIAGNRTSTQAADKAETIAVIDAKAVAQRSTSAFQLLNNAAGLRVRQNGGLGSSSDISLNGISGKQVKLFVDGIPLDNTGLYTAFYSVPVNLIDRIEVLKGVVPVYLGADALGGAINLVTRQDDKNYVSGSVEGASFHTLKSSIAFSYKLPKTPIRFSTTAYYNESKNNYLVEGEVRNPDFTTDTSYFRRFHDGFQSRMVSSELLVTKYRFIDKLSVRYTATGATKDIQQNFYFPTLSVAYGNPFVRETSRRGELNFEKKDLLNKKLDVLLYTSFTKLSTQFVDTSKNRYDWTGKVIQRNANGGELSATAHTLDLRTNNLLSRSFVTYRFNPKHFLSVNAVLSNVQQEGSDTAATKGSPLLGPKPDIYKIPQYVRKLVAGVSYTSKFFNERLTNDLGVKYYEIEFKAVSTSIFSSELTPFTAHRSNRGAFNAIRYELLKDKLFIKSSYEYASRLPDQYEVLGDRVFIITNPNIRPEISNNVNAGFQLKLDGSLGRFTVDANLFNRHTKDNIFLVIAAASQYQNIATVRYKGFDIDASYSPIPYITIKGNITYQEARNRTDTNAVNPTVNKRYYNAQLPNRPVFFANTEVNLFYPEIFTSSDRMDLYWWSNYTDPFYRAFAIDGDPAGKERVERQLIQNVGLSYTVLKYGTSLSAEVHNYTNTKAFDYFSVQKPGVSYHVKLSFFISQFKPKSI